MPEVNLRKFVIGERDLDYFIVCQANSFKDEHPWIRHLVPHHHEIINKPQIFPTFVTLDKIIFNDENESYIAFLKD